MITRTIKLLSLLVTSGLYWQIVCQLTGVKEPWDANAYWFLWYPLSVVLAAIAGYIFRKDSWIAGGVITFAQLPVMWINSGTGPLIAVGLLFLCILAAPAVAISLLTGQLATRARSA